MGKTVVNKGKCDAIKGKWCGAIKMFAQFHDPVSKGLCVTDCIDTKTFVRGHGLLYRPKSNANKTIWLNFCPFCGADVSDRTPSKKESKNGIRKPKRC